MYPLIIKALSLNLINLKYGPSLFLTTIPLTAKDPYFKLCFVFERRGNFLYKTTTQNENSVRTSVPFVCLFSVLVVTKPHSLK